MQRDKIAEIVASRVRKPVDGDSIWEFIESLVIDYELWSEDGVL